MDNIRAYLADVPAELKTKLYTFDQIVELLVLLSAKGPKKAAKKADDGSDSEDEKVHEVKPKSKKTARKDESDDEDSDDEDSDDEDSDDEEGGEWECTCKEGKKAGKIPIAKCCPHCQDWLCDCVDNEVGYTARKTTPCGKCGVSPTDRGVAKKAAKTKPKKTVSR